MQLKMTHAADPCCRMSALIRNKANCEMSEMQETGKFLPVVKTLHHRQAALKIERISSCFLFILLPLHIWCISSHHPRCGVWPARGNFPDSQHMMRKSGRVSVNFIIHNFY